MSVPVKPHHPLTELLAGLLSGIQVVPLKEQTRMKNRAIREAVKWHKDQIKKMTWWINDMERDIWAEKGVCPECHRRLGNLGIDAERIGNFGIHKEDCELGIMLVSFREELK